MLAVMSQERKYVLNGVKARGDGLITKMSSRRLINRSLSSDGRSYFNDFSSPSRRSGARSYLSSISSESRSTLCSVMAQLTEERQPTFESTLKSKAVSEDANVKFSCVVSGHPVPDVTWYKDDMQLDRYCGLPKYEISRHDKTHTLQIYNCTLEDAAIYQASAQNSRGIVSCSGVLEVGTMSEYKIHQNYFSKLKLRSEHRQHKHQETIPEDIRMRSPERTHVEAQRRMEKSPLEDRTLEIDPPEDGLWSPVQETTAEPVHSISTAEVSTNKESKELMYIHDSINDASKLQIERNAKISPLATEQSNRNRSTRKMLNKSGVSVENTGEENTQIAPVENIDKTDTKKNEKQLVMTESSKTDTTDNGKKGKLSGITNKEVTETTQRDCVPQTTSATETDATNTKESESRPVNTYKSTSEEVDKQVETPSEELKEDTSILKKNQKPAAKKLPAPKASVKSEVVKNTNQTQPFAAQLKVLQTGNTRIAVKRKDFDEHRNRHSEGPRVRISPHSSSRDDVNVDTGDGNASEHSLMGLAADDGHCNAEEPSIHCDVPTLHKEMVTVEEPSNPSSSVSQEDGLSPYEESATLTKISSLVTEAQNTQPRENISSGHVSHKLQDTQFITDEGSLLGEEIPTNKPIPNSSDNKADNKETDNTTRSDSNSPLITPSETHSPRLNRRTVPADQPKTVANENPKLQIEKDKENQFKVPQVIRKIRPEVFDASGHLKLWCQFFNIISDSTIKWYKDEMEISEIKRSAGDETQVCLAIIQMSKRDCGVYRCSITNEYGKDFTEYHLNTEFLSSVAWREELQQVGEEIEMTPLIFSRGLADAGCWGSKFFGRVTTEEAQIGLGSEHKTKRLKVIYGLDPVFESGSSCFMKMQSPIAYESREETVLAERNLQITKQNCRIQNMAREYFKIFAGDTRQIESFGAALEVIPLYFTYWPASSVPYATVEAELKGIYLRYCGLDRAGSLVFNEKSEVGQKYQGFPCAANPQVFERFLIQHQCNYYCGLLNLRPLKSPESLQTSARSKGSSSPLLQRRTPASSSSPQPQRRANKSPKVPRKINPDVSA
ncbi:hypothetical protein DNTS_024328 [Danionella cerebrum]|uniref:non-specific serine/threonine protein kinase n=1 Tax=Danionella cerebrum TaxID=2873325 RepID=A0A553NLL9_9TELE|nr:hypothetical protein DNTS_024328 [Danionella translucida]